MHDWNDENGALICERKGRGMGCVYPILSVFGFLVFAVAGLFILVAIDEGGPLSDKILPGLISLFGFVFFLAGFTGRKFSFYSRVRIDRDAGALELSREKDKIEYRMGLAEVERIALFKVLKSRGGSSSGAVTTYQIFLVKKDGAFFWLDTFANQEKFTEAATRLAEYTGFPLKDDTGLLTDLDRQREYSDRFGDQGSYEPSRFLEIENASDGTRLKLRENRGFLERLLMVAVFTLFLSVPFYIILQVVENSGGGDPGSLAFAFLAIPFALIFFAIVVMVMLLGAKRYEIVYRGSELVLDLKFGALLNAMLGKRLTIPRGTIRAVRVNRLDDGHFWLSLAVDRAFQSPAGGGMLFALGAFAKPKAQVPTGQENVISLWELIGQTRPGKGAGLNDLLHIEDLLQKDLGIDESRGSP